jgi:hypothetical protein
MIRKHIDGKLTLSKRKKVRDASNLLNCICIKSIDFGTVKFTSGENYGYKESDKGCRRLLLVRGNFEAGMDSIQFGKYFKEGK